MTDQSNPENTPDPAASWEAQLEEAVQDQGPARRNGFDAGRKKTFLKALAKGATLTEAAKAACVGKRTVYSHMEKDPLFAAACEAAAQVVAPVIELEAFKRGVTGVEEDVISYGKHAGTRIKRSDSLLTLLLKGSNPAKYGARAGFARAKVGKKKWRAQERERIRAELLVEQEEGGEPAEQIRDRIARRLDLVCGELKRRLVVNEGWVLHEETDRLIPPGWMLIRDENAHNACAERAECAELTDTPLAPLTRASMGRAIMQLM